MFTGLSWYKIGLGFKSKNVNKLLINVFNSIVKESYQKAFPEFVWENNDRIPIFFHIKNKSINKVISLKDTIEVEIIIIENNEESVFLYYETLVDYIKEHSSEYYELIRIEAPVLHIYEDLVENTSAIIGKEICLEFMTPFLAESIKNQRTYISKEDFVSCFSKRLSRLFGTEIKYIEGDDDFEILPYYWHYTEIQLTSKSQPRHKNYITGCVGKLYIKGDFTNFLPFLIIGQELHCSTSMSYSQGYYNILWESAPYFDEILMEENKIISVINELKEKIDPVDYFNAVYPEDNEKLAKIISKELKKEYKFTENNGFVIKKQDGGDRMVERLDFKDNVVAKHIHKILTEVFERIFSDSSIGFRKGVSLYKASKIINTAIKDGYEYVLESDIEAFFQSIDIKILKNIINRYIPENDRILKKCIFSMIDTGYKMNGESFERKSGVAQGNPVSPLLANIYLNEFDSYIDNMGKSKYRYVRYADDFIIMTKGQEEAFFLLKEIKAYLSKIGLRLKDKKTSIINVKEEGFDFLGMGFGEKKENDFKNVDVSKMEKKPLYISEAFQFMGLNSDCIEIIKNSKIKEVYPLYRISEIVCVENVSLSTALIKKCYEMKIPVTLTYGSGYFAGTMRPEAKSFYDTTFSHNMRFNNLSHGEITAIAKELASRKIKEYIHLFEEKYKKGNNETIKQLRKYIKEINEAEDVAAIRGFEGVAAKTTFKCLNTLMLNSNFYIEKRERNSPDMINSLLNFGYYMLFAKINTTLRVLGLNPYLGFLHSPENKYESFAYDIVELYRAVIDKEIIKMINYGTINEESFNRAGNDKYVLNKIGKAKFLNAYNLNMTKKDNIISLEDEIYLQCMVFKEWALNGKGIIFYRGEER